ncbi:NlpC/P60 family protein [Frankia sp. AgKG'84/4]|nr:C40 family peptidase [Frankia sp. AgKG'84/4]MCL9797835.1 NlpC/P60 family protein [Frankia sp. AgKG'84/4]
MPRRGMAWLPEDWEQFVRNRQRPPAPRASSGSDAVRRRTTVPPRRAATIAAFTTGSIAVSTAAFAATVPSGVDGTASLDANSPTQSSVLTGHTGRADLTTSRTIAPLATAIADHDPVFTNVSIAADKSTVAPNTPVVLTVRATEADSGAPLANQDVRIVVVNGPQWQTSTRLHTDANGNAQITARLLSTTTITAVFDGSSALRPSLAGAATVTIASPTTSGGGAGGAGAGIAAGIDQAIPKIIPGSSIGEKAVYLASLNKGKPYVWGAEGPYSFDCSGLVQYVFKQLGRSLPRTAQGQYNVSTKVPQAGKQPGDLIFYGTPGNIYHVGIYAGNGYMWAAPQTGGVVSLRPIYSSTYKVGRIH